MSAALLLLLSLSGLVLAKEPPDVECLIVHLKHINCSWNKPAAPRVNYTFHSRFGTSQKPSSCSSYTEEDGVRTGCVQPYEPPRSDRFNVFYITLSLGNQTSEQSLNLKSKVKLNPPVNLTVQNGSDYNLWFYWNQTKKGCVESEIRYRTNYNKWEFNKLQTSKQDFCINLPSSSSRYELQVRSRIGNSCGESEFWSDWSEPVVWGFNSTVPNQTLASAWTPFFYVVGAFTLVLLVTLLLHHERLRIIPIPVPKPLPVFHNLEDWLQYPKVQKEDFKTNYNELVCSVSEYRPDPSDSESSDGSSFSVTTDQTDCSVCITVTKEEEEFSPDSSSSSSSSSTSPMLPEPQE